MDIRQLKYFVAVAEHQNFSRAAAQLYVAQSALSRRIHDLERELGVRLFDRHLRGAALTPEGRDLLERAAYLLRGFEQLRSDLGTGHSPAFGPIAIGMTHNFSAAVGAPLAQRVRQCFPGAQLRIEQGYSPELRELVRSGALDLSLLSGHPPRAVDNLAVEPLFEDRLCLIGPSGDPRMARSEITVSQLKGLPLILTGPSSSGVRNELESLASRKRVTLDVVVEVASFELAARMIRLGMGYTVYVAEGLVEQADLVAVPISGLWLNRSLAWPLDRPMSRLGAEVLQLVRHHLYEQVTQGRWIGAGPWRGSTPA